jgi:hypothetical protein
MFARNQTFIKQTLAQLAELRRQPYRKRRLALDIQERLIVGITRAERNIRRNKARAAILRRQLRTPGGNKEKSKLLKVRLGRAADAVEEQQAMVRLYRDIGDAIAFIYLDRYDLKQLSQNQPAGSLTGKTGNRLERSILRRLFADNRIAILNDLTSSLRRGDLTVVLKYRQFIVIEAKSGGGGNRARQERQTKALADIHNYLATDHREWEGQTVIRQAVSVRPRYHWREFNRLVKDLRNGVEDDQTTSPERGVTYAAIRNANVGSAVVEAARAMQCGFFFWLNDAKGAGAAYEPLPLIFEDPDDLIAFYRAEFLVLVIVDFAAVARSMPSGVTVQFGPSEAWPLTVIAEGDEPEEERTRTMGRHFVWRVAAELVSAKWILRHALTPLNAEMLAIMETTRKDVADADQLLHLNGPTDKPTVAQA